MHNFLRCRRGTAAFAVVVALVPLIGVVALGGEAGSWYVTKQHAQNAADTAAYSAGLQLACSISGKGTCGAQDYVYRGKQFAAQNAFCDAGDTTSYPGRQCATSLPTGTSQTVQINTLTAWNGVNGNFVQATVSQQQPAYLATVLGMSTVNIGATAIAKFQVLPTNPCVLALTGSISFQGSPNINSPGCGIHSNDPAKDALQFTGGVHDFNAPLSAAGGCIPVNDSHCSSALTYGQPVTNPFSALDKVNLPTMTSCPVDKKIEKLTPWSAATPCTNDNADLKGNTNIALCGGVYFISGQLTLRGSTSLYTPPPGDPTCLGQPTGALLILLPGASFSMKGTGTITITGNPSVSSTQVPAELQPYTTPNCAATNQCLLVNMAIYDLSSDPVTIGGNSNLNFTGTLYFPNAAVTFQGNPTLNFGGGMGGCGELIAASVAFNGNATLDSTGCSTATKPSLASSVSLVH